MKLWLALGALLAVLALYPTLAAALLGAAAVWAAAKPPVLAFAAGLAAGPRIAKRIRRWT